MRARKTGSSLKKLSVPALHIVLYACMLVLLVYSLRYYKLRIFSDVAGCLTELTRNNGFATGHSRFIIVVNQMLPVALLQLGASLKAVAIAYSFNHTLVPVILALLCIHGLKRVYHGVAILLLAVLMSVLLFYYPISELQTGLFFLLFYDAVADSMLESSRWKRFALVSLVIAPVLIFSHPMMLPTLLGWLLYRILKDRKDIRNTSIAAACFAVAYFVKKVWFSSSYEVVQTLTWDRVKPFGLNYYDGPFAHSIYAYTLKEAFMLPIVLLITFVLLFRQKKFGLAVLLFAFVVGILSLILVNFEDWGTHFYDQYYEHMIQPIVFFIALLFCYVLSRTEGREWIKAAALALICVVSLAKISTGSEEHIARQRWIGGYLDLMDSLNLKKAVAGRKWVPEGMVKGSFWSSNWESLILSSLENPARSKTLFLAWDTANLHEPWQSGEEFLLDGGSYKQSTLPTRYFQLGSKPYVILETVVPDSVLLRLLWK